MMIPRKLQEILSDFSESEKRMVLSAYESAAEALQGKMRSNSSPFIEHPLAVAHIVCREMGLQADAAAATLLHEANRFQTDNVAELNKTPLLESFRAEYPHDIIEIVEGLNNISNVQLQEANLDEERYRKLIISYSTDPRVILIKLADRLEVMRSINILPPAKRTKKLMETMMLYIPLAHQLGLYRVKSELEDIFLKYTEPEKYKEITRKIKETEPQREALVEQFINPLREKLDREGIRYTLKARTKSPYSIWRKMQAQQITFDKVYDLFAMRFIIDCEPDHKLEEALCWKVYSLVTEEYTPDTKRLRDWISKPRDNGYESLHTTVRTKEGLPVEVQIRTTRMDYIAEKGNAAHWSYKGIKGGKSHLTDWLNQVRDLMQSSEEEKYEHASLALDELLVYTPTGDLRQLHAGSTVLDFAFEIHSKLGLRCTGARVNGKMCSIREKLHTGDVVEIISSKNQKPTADWLNFVVSSKARSKIKQKLKEEENARAATGKELLARRLKNWKMVISDGELWTLARRNRFGTLNEFFGAIGNGQFDVALVKDFLVHKMETETAAESTTETKTPETAHADRSGIESGDFLIDRKLKGVDLKPAKCCTPAYGDPIFGFLTIRDGIKIHRINCPNAARLRENYPYRVIEVSWKTRSSEKDGDKGDTHKRRQG